jgi:replication factor C subunit 3/5
MLSVSNTETDRSQMSLPWVEKYRPDSFEEIVCHSGTILTIRKFLAERKLPHLFFYGPPGTGKTSMAMTIAKELHGSFWKSSGNVLELNASDDRGIDTVREQIKTFASSGIFTGMDTCIVPKLVILDEADAMTSAAQNALRRIIEKYVQRVRFILIGNYSGQIIPALQSRCTKFRFVPLDRPSMMSRIGHVTREEKISVSNEAAEALVDLAEGDMRKVLNWLQAASSSKREKTVIAKDIYLVSASPEPEDLEQFWEIPLKHNIGDAFTFLKGLQMAKGISTADVIKHIRQKVIEKQAGGCPLSAIIFALQELADSQARVASGCNEPIQLAGLIGVVTGFQALLKHSH